MNNAQYNKWILEVANQEYSGNLKLFLNSFYVSSFMKPPVLYKDRGSASILLSIFASCSSVMLTPRKVWRVIDGQVSGKIHHSPTYYNNFNEVN